ncbi:MAG: hypothetical protein ACE5ER_00290 [Nitrospinaceae bacterium]
MDSAVRLALQSHPKAKPEVVVFEVKSNLHRILSLKEELSIADEVRGHFEKAVNKAEEKMEEGEGDISQSAITKLKLGLAGTMNDITKFTAEMAIARLKLGYWIGREIPDSAVPSEKRLAAIDFSPTRLEAYYKWVNKPPHLKDEPLLILKEAVIKVNLAREQMALARKNRKITRALLVTEVANYDFGIGDEGELFEALIIYTRVLVGYYQTIYEFNLKVLEFEKTYSRLTSGGPS